MLSLLMVQGSGPPGGRGGGGCYKGRLAGNAAAGSEEPKGGTSCSCVVLVKAGQSSYLSHCVSSTWPVMGNSRSVSLPSGHFVVWT